MCPFWSSSCIQTFLLIWLVNNARFGFNKRPCYVMLCFVKVCYVMVWYGTCMLCYVMLWYVLLCYVMLWYVMLWYVMLCHNVYHVISCFVMQGLGHGHRNLYHDSIERALRWNNSGHLVVLYPRKCLNRRGVSFARIGETSGDLLSKD